MPARYRLVRAAERVACALLLAATGVGQAGCSRAHRHAAPGAPLAARLADADPAHGARLFHQCAACHNASQGGTDRDGPNLWGVLGGPVATLRPRFAYTNALKQAGGIWTCARMDAWLADPARFVPGTAMLFPGLPDGGDRADVIAHLAQAGGTPGDASCAALGTTIRPKS